MAGEVLQDRYSPDLRRRLAEVARAVYRGFAWVWPVHAATTSKWGEVASITGGL